MKIIIVDDEEVIRDSAFEFFNMMGNFCKTASCGQEALSMLKKEEVDVVLTDFRMPDMNGIELLKTIRKLYPKIKVIIYTGYASKENAMDAVNYGAYGFFRKPLDRFKLVNMIEQIKREHHEHRS